MSTPTLSFAMLISLHDEDFVTAAYALLLGRPADEAGTNYYLGRLRAGYSKLSILQQLRGSSEFQYPTQSVTGLNKALKRYRISQIPLIGWLFRKWWNIEGEGVEERYQRVIINELASIRQQLQQGIAQSAAITAIRTNQMQRDSNSIHRRPSGEHLAPDAREIFERLVSQEGIRN